MAALAVCACAAPPPPQVEASDGRYLMGTVLEVRLFAADAVQARAALEACFALGRELEAIFTTFDPSSATSLLNASADGEPHPVPPALRRLVAESIGWTALTRGGFDVTVGPLVALWKEAARRDRLPSDAEIAAARARVGAARIRLDGAEGVALPAGAALDFGGVAKGWALDRMGERLAALGVRRALLDFGGSSWLGVGAPPEGDAWRVVVAAAGGHLLGPIALRDQSLSVSDSLGQSSEIGGRRFGHVIDPRSGRPLEGGTLAVVRAGDGGLAEALSTAAAVLGADDSVALFATLPGVDGVVIQDGGARAATPGFRELLEAR